MKVITLVALAVAASGSEWEPRSRPRRYVQVDPNVRRDENSKVVSSIPVKRTGKNHDVHGGWSKVLRGHNKGKPTWKLGGNFRWRRDVQPWQVIPYLRQGGSGNAIPSVRLMRTEENNDVERRSRRDTYVSAVHLHYKPEFVNEDPFSDSLSVDEDDDEYSRWY